jgi:hypothetical protein
VPPVTRTARRGGAEGEPALAGVDGGREPGLGDGADLFAQGGFGVEQPVEVAGSEAK